MSEAPWTSERIAAFLVDGAEAIGLLEAVEQNEAAELLYQGNIAFCRYWNEVLGEATLVGAIRQESKRRSEPFSDDPDAGQVIPFPLARRPRR